MSTEFPQQPGRVNDALAQAAANRYPDSPGFKVGGTSEDAAASVEDEAPILRNRVLKVLADDPATADECAAQLGASVLSIRPRVTELKQQGRITDAGFRRRNLSGRKAIVWKLVA